MSVVKTALAQQNPFEGLAFEIAATYQAHKLELSHEERYRRIIALMLASYFSSERAGFGATEQPIDVLCSAIQSAGGQVSDVQRAKYLPIVSFSPARYGVIVSDEQAREEVISAFDVLQDISGGSIEDRQRIVAEKLRAVEVAPIPTVRY